MTTRFLVVFASIQAMLLLADSAHADPMFEVGYDLLPDVTNSSWTGWSYRVVDLNHDGRLDFVAVAGPLNRYDRGTFHSFVQQGDGRFTMAASIAVSFMPTDLAIGDFDADGQTDVVVADYGRTFDFLHGDGSGGFSPAGSREVLSDTRAIVTSDLNHDGRDDILVADGSARVTVLMASPSGFLPQTFDATTAVDDLATADLNDDDIPDLLTTGISTGLLSTFRGTGDGGFADRRDLVAGREAFGLATGDLDVDGQTDVAVACSDATLAVFLGNGDGSMEPGSILHSAANPIAVTIGDLDGDSLPDLVTANGQARSCTIHFGDGQGGAASAVECPVGGFSRRAVVGDFDSDGHRDVVADRGATDMARIDLHGGRSVPRIEHPTGREPFSIRMHDLNADGFEDVIVANRRSDDVSILYGRADGTLAPSENHRVVGPQSVAVGDMNRDGRVDVVVATLDTNGSAVSVLLARADGTFAAEVRTLVPLPERSQLAVADFDEDGLLDVAMTHIFPEGAEGSLLLLRGRGDGTFDPSTAIDAGRFPNRVLAADFDRDGHVDLVASNRTHVVTSPSTVSVLMGAGNGTFAPRVAYPIQWESSRDLAAGDFDGDGDLDLVSVDILGFELLSGRGDGSFENAPMIIASFGCGAVTTGDFDGDGRLDVAAANHFRNTLDVCLGNGDLTFSAWQRFGPGATPIAVAAGDLDHDDRDDVVVANLSSGSITAFRTRSPATPIAIEELSAAIGPTSVVLSWKLAPAFLSRYAGVTVQRAFEVDVSFLDASGVLPAEANMSFEDRGVQAGASCWYRIAIELRSGGRWFSPPLHVAGERVARTELRKLTVSDDAVHIEYAIGETGARARLAIFDVRGRRIWSHGPDLRGPGLYVTSWNRRNVSGALSPRGIYFVDLAAGAQRSVRRLVLIKK